MNGPDHYLRAAELLRCAETGVEPPPYSGDDQPQPLNLSPATLIASAAVHAQLAKTAAYVEVIGLAQTDQLGPLPVPDTCDRPDCAMAGRPHLHQPSGEPVIMAAGMSYFRFQGNAWHDALHGPVDPAGEPVPPSEVRR